jgi:hypothetical protein
MRKWIRARLTYANVGVTLLGFVVLTGGTAVALGGHDTVQSDDLGPGAQVKAPDVAANAVKHGDVVNESLTGEDIKNQSGVDTCTHGTVRFGELCVRVADDGDQTWYGAQELCSAYELRLPSLGEAQALAKNHDLPNVGPAEYFWSEEFFQNATIGNLVWTMRGDGGTRSTAPYLDTRPTVCVTTPTN